MKYTLIVIVAIIATTYQTFAQDFFAVEQNESGLYVLGGYTSSTISVPHNSAIRSAKNISTMKSGLLADLRLNNRLSIVTGINISPHGAKVVSATKLYDNTIVRDTGKFTPTFLQLPLMLTAKFQLSEGLHFYVGVGPYIAWGISGKTERELTVDGNKTTISRNIEFTSDPVPARSKDGLIFSQISPLNYGVCGQTGFEFKKFILALDVSLAMSPIANLITEPGYQNTNRYQTLSICFGRRL